MLSTLHQSSLGTLLLIMPFRVHPLWYSPRLAELFFVSAICLGLNMVMFESTITSWLYRRKPETAMLEGLAKMAAWALAFYLASRVGEDSLRAGGRISHFVVRVAPLALGGSTAGQHLMRKPTTW